MGFELRVTGYGIQVARCALQDTSCGLRVMGKKGIELRAQGIGQGA